MESKNLSQDNKKVQAAENVRKRDFKAKTKDNAKKSAKVVLSASSTQPDSQAIKIAVEHRSAANIMKTQFSTLSSVL